MLKVGTTALKARLGKFMRAVRAGREILITDRGRPIARLVPIAAENGAARACVIRPRLPTSRPPGKVRVAPIRYGGPDSTALLRADRDRR